MADAHKVRTVIAEYRLLLEQFLAGAMSVDVFKTTYLDRFKNEARLGKALFLLLDKLFGEIDSFTTDPELLAENPSFYLDEAQLRGAVRRTLARLSMIEAGEAR